ncbi:hypothetical protein [Leptospira bandrabouensis]|uniref:Uncharacterized protein n=1 Tax=Leptospira bandrabouensis TaxID=2484903 RepID=A0A6H3NLM6_9LEPT|nr:hypothetical protein [Leptospira bandrabouensis]TGN09556.1 hypothetical protein EHR07_00930 [Leptospira bandrabouensis]TGN10738.1 hypothetical protein EHR08_18980 [Leptospira bandrabouensis]
MRNFLLKSIAILGLTTLVTCSLFKKDKKEEDMLNAFLLLLWANSQSAGCSGPKSGFTICIPKGIAE